MPKPVSPQFWTVVLAIAALAVLLYLFTHPTQRRAPRHREAEHRRPYSHERRREPERERRTTADCSALGIRCESQYLAGWSAPGAGSCAIVVRGGNTFPDPRCTPGGINPSITAETLRDPDFRTRCDRNCATSEAEKHVTYGWYGVAKPPENSGENQVCELDHLVPLELGGADGLGNIWPECGPSGAPLPGRNFKIKDRVENYLADEVRAGRMPLDEAQRGIAEDWARYLPAANHYCREGGRC